VTAPVLGPGLPRWRWGRKLEPAGERRVEHEQRVRRERRSVQRPGGAPRRRGCRRRQQRHGEVRDGPGRVPEGEDERVRVRAVHAGPDASAVPGVPRPPHRQVPTWLKGRVGGRILGVRCDIRYDNDLFFARSHDMVTLTPLVDTSKG
jgi:hypothetical protein